MNTVKKIIELYGGLEWSKSENNYIKILNEPFMPLVIEYIGEGPRNLPKISVAHYYKQNGDAMRDPDMVFEVSSNNEWFPISYRQDGLGIYNEAVYQKMRQGRLW